jgi:cell division protein FtsB
MIAVAMRFWWAFPILLLAVGLMSTRSRLEDVKVDRDNHRAFGELVAEATRDAAGNPKLRKDRVPAQIAALGRGVETLKTNLQTANRSARDAAGRDAAAQAHAAEQLADVERRAASGQATIDRLRASAAAPRSPARAGCEPSQTLKDLWK